MAMACRAGAAPAGRPAKPVAANSVASAPRSSVRRDACKCVTCGEAKMGARGGRMRFVRFWVNLSQPVGRRRPRIFGAFVALLQGEYRLSGSPWGVTPPPYFARREPSWRDRPAGREAADGRNKG